ncbi:MAG: hypothetical protein HY866_11175 [Chloroflexi bacterium]|nr:hypothetical protein [Chloroflexota bacterium]
MYDRFRKMSFLGQIITMMVLLFVALTVVNLAIGLISRLIPLAIAAAVIVGLLWLFDKDRK